MKLLELNRQGSDFVNITAWLTMALSLVWCVMSLVYLIVFLVFVPQAEFLDFVDYLIEEGMLPLSIGWLANHLMQYFITAIVFGPVLLYSGFDLLRRKEWARKFVMIMIAISVLANLLPLAALVAWPEYMFPPLALAEEPLTWTRGMMGFLIVVLNALLVGMIVKFQSAGIRGEFA